MDVPVFIKFPGKVLLFGEYLVLQGEEALATPIKNFEGQLVLHETFMQENIAPFIQYLGALPNIFLKQDLIESLELDKLVFESSIPIGYGSGSSGALTAAVFDAFVEKYEGSLQDALASMEDFFHGSSSGMDPLVSFQGKPTKPIDERSIKHFYLLDTGISRKTAPLVQIFKEKTEDISFDELAQFNRSAISAMEVYDYKLLKKSLEQISAFQYENFKEMIPRGFKSHWQEALADEHLKVKLCGAGGGGFLLVFADDVDYADKWAGEKGVKLIKILT
jgi:mevalonate kinase